IRVVDRPEAGLAVVLAAGLDRRAVESVDRLAAAGGEGDMGAGAGPGLAAPGEGHADPEGRLVLGRAVAIAARDRMEHAETERLQRLIVEFPGPGQVRHAQRDVIEHPLPPSDQRRSSAPMPWRARPFWPSLPTCFIMRAISICCFSSLLTSCTVAPEPAAMRCLREALMISGRLRSLRVMEEMIACWRRSMLSSILALSSCLRTLPAPGSMPRMLP